MKTNPLLKLRDFGQRIWLDFLRRAVINSGDLEKMIDEDGLGGVTSNPSIFEKAIAGSSDYDGAIRALALEGRSVEEIYQALTVQDIQRAADIFRPLYDRLEGEDGFVSLEVSPHLAYDAKGTVAEARRLWAAANRPNVFIKVPATQEGLPAIRQLISEGINVNVTLLFGLPRYREVAEAYISGLEAAAADGKALDRISSVASFFLSRIDALIDPMIEKLIQAGGPDAAIAKEIHGQVAIASARIAYQIYREIFHGERFKKLADRGAGSQRLLWASTSTKNPSYSDVRYVEALIGPKTINTLPLETINAYRDHGDPVPRLEEGVEEAADIFVCLPQLGIDSDAITQQLEDEGVEKFSASYDALMQTLAKHRAAALAEPLDRQAIAVTGYEEAVRKRLDALGKERFCDRLWRKDAGLWKSGAKEREQIRNSLGWLHVAEKMEENLRDIEYFVRQVKNAGFRHVVHMGMGGSSLAPLVFERTVAPAQHALLLTVLDTTDPATILAVERRIPVGETLFIVASKSGTTAEPLAFGEYFFARVRELKGEKAGENFVAITDPGTPLVKLAGERGFRKIFLNYPDIGGRYSALSYFGLVPVALMGVNIGELLMRALRMTHACAGCVPNTENPGVALGAAMGELARKGRNKVTFLIPEAISSLGMWLEQLIAESTGKEGTGLLPVAGEPLCAQPSYGADRLFISIHLKGAKDEELERTLAILKESRQPLISIQMEDALDLGQEFLRWEIATATAGAVLGINPFDQPNVQESKDNTNRLLAVAGEKGGIPDEAPSLTEGTLALYGKDRGPTVAEVLKKFLSAGRVGDYVALMAYMTESPENDKSLQAIRLTLCNRLHLATTLGYGPRYLHSTGQMHKGGPPTGLFIQITADDPEDAAIPGQPYGFSVFKKAQALGDLEALRVHGRRVMRIHLSGDSGRGLEELARAVDAALARA
ncbi:MAG: bifunctional transaldolase/phosoglucose isomerase [Candidatus Aureabacteria bacterium]|nr:bifunctional transaldolase/phosoglucose isomerase [Candidatus Auribacterota bacterium]